MQTRRILIVGGALGLGLALALANLGAAVAADQGYGHSTTPPQHIAPQVAALGAGSESHPQPGWTTSIDKGGDTTLTRLNRRSALGKGPSQPIAAPTYDGTRIDQFGCRYRFYRSTSLRAEVVSRCYVTHR